MTSSTVGGAADLGGAAGGTASIYRSRRVNSPVVGHRPRLLDVLKALGDNTRYAIYLELAGRPRRWPRRTSPRRWPSTPTPSGRTSSACATSACSTSTAEVRLAVGRPQHRYSLAGARRSGSSRRATRCWPACSSAWPSGRRAATRRPRSAASRAADAARYAKRRVVPRGLVDQLDVLGFDPAVDGRRRRDRRRSRSPTARSASWPRPIPSSSAPCTAGMVEGFVDAMGDAEVDDFHTLVHRPPARSRSRAGNLYRASIPGGAP